MKIAGFALVFFLVLMVLGPVAASAKPGRPLNQTTIVCYYEQQLWTMYVRCFYTSRGGTTEERYSYPIKLPNVPGKRPRKPKGD